jgi:hypothetical protein
MSLLDRVRDGHAISTSLQKSLSAQTNTGDPRFWNVTRGVDGTGLAIGRFLPNVKGDGPHFITATSYRFTNPATGLTYSENALTTIGKNDPVQDYFSMLWNQGRQDEAKRFRRNQTHIANFLVIKDTGKPENNGKVKLYRFAKTIHDKVEDAQKERPGGMPIINPFFLFSYPRSASDDEQAAWIGTGDAKRYPGANFAVRVKLTGKKMADGSPIPEYGDSAFEWPSALGTEEYMEQVLNETFDLGEFVDPKMFKSYEELKAQLDKVMGFDTSSPSGTPVCPGTKATQDPGKTEAPYDASLMDDVQRLRQLIGESA